MMEKNILVIMKKKNVLCFVRLNDFESSSFFKCYGGEGKVQKVFLRDGGMSGMSSPTCIKIVLYK